MRDVISENPLLMKKVCMGVLVCSTSCNFTDDSVGYRPAATEKTFKDQIGRCPLFIRHFSFLLIVRCSFCR